MKRIDDKLNLISKFITEYQSDNGFPPTIREICKSCSIKSTATAYAYIERLKDKGILTNSPLKKRSIKLAGAVSFRSVPLIGTIRAGQPILAYENIDGYYPLPPDFDKNNDVFALKVKGDSMINAGIMENDIIIVNKQETAENGDIVVALIEDFATVKRFYKRNGQVVLHPENDDMQDMVFDDVSIIGIVKGLMRKF